MDCVGSTVGWGWWYAMRGITEGEYWLSRYKRKLEGVIENMEEAQHRLDEAHDVLYLKMQKFVRQHGHPSKYRKNSRPQREWVRMKKEFRLQERQIEKNSNKLIGYRSLMYTAETNAAVWNETALAKAFIKLETNLTTSQGGVDGILETTGDMKRSMENAEELQIATGGLLGAGSSMFDDDELEDELDELFAEEVNPVAERRNKNPTTQGLMGGHITLPEYTRVPTLV